MRALALTLCCALAAAGCNTTYTIVRREQRVARIKVSTDVDGATVYSGDKPRGSAPATLSLPYTVLEKKVESGTVKTGWLAIATGAVAALAGVGLTYWGAASAGDPTSSSAFSGIGLGFGPLLSLYALVALIGGIYMVSTGSEPNRFDTDPAALQVGVQLPDSGRLEEVRLTASGTARTEPPFGDVGKLHYAQATGQWSAGTLPDSLELKPVELRSGGHQQKPAAAVATVQRGDSSRRPGARETPIVAVFDVETRGTRLSPGLRARISDYLTAQVAASGAFQVVPRDQLKKRLRRQKRASYKRCYDQSCQIAIGRELAAQKSLSTMVVRLGSKCSITSVLYDLRRSASEGGASASGGCSEDGLAKTLDALVKKLEARPPR